MLNLDPGKLLVIAIVAIILLGPDKLPQFARQVGGAWRSFNEFRHRMETEVRSNMPDLPPSSEIARLARSPSALLTHLSNMGDDEEDNDEAPDGSTQAPVAANGEAAAAAGRTAGAGETDGGRGRPPGGAPSVAPQAPSASTNGKPDVAPQPTDVAVPADPTLN